jgi:hypothetical protein
MRPSRALVILGALALLACSCGKPAGTISGHLYRVGGPYPGLPTPVSGAIIVSGEESSAVVWSDGSFSVVVREGTYMLSGRSPEIDNGTYLCQARHSVAVTAGVVTTMDVICDIP